VVVAVALFLGACAADHAAAPVSVLVSVKATQYRVLYKVERTAAPGEHGVAWEVLTVVRPFLASDLTFDQRPTDLMSAEQATPVSGTVSDIDHLYSVEGETVRRIAGRQPGTPNGDQSLASIAVDAVKAGAARVGGRQRIIGRTCTDLVLYEPPAGPLHSLDKTDNHDDLCLDRSGIMLRERWTLNGKVVQTRRAVAVAEGEMLPAETRDAALDTSSADEAPALLAIPRTMPMEGNPTPPPTPAGYALASAVGFTLPRADVPSAIAYGSNVWAYAKGPDAITVEAGAGQVLPWRPDTERRVTVAGRHAAAVIRSDGTEVHWRTADGWVRVRSTQRLADTLRYARLLSSWDSSPAAVPK
jgi:hypothetical protein